MAASARLEALTVVHTLLRPQTSSRQCGHRLPPPVPPAFFTSVTAALSALRTVNCSPMHSLRGTTIAGYASNSN